MNQIVNKPPTLGESALWYGAQGYRVLPIVPGDKRPLIKDWPTFASNDAQVIHQWWTQWPAANIAIACGEGSGLVVLDLDVKDGKDGLASARELLNGSAHLLDGVVQTTPSGGRHVLFQYLPDLKNFTNKGSAGGIDMRTDRGYILVEPSVIGGRPYAWNQTPLRQLVPPMPEELVPVCLGWSIETAPPSVGRPEQLESVPELSTLALSPEARGYLVEGVTEPYGSDESAALHAVAQELAQVTGDASVTWSILSTNPFTIACAHRHRTFGDRLDWLWKYGVSNGVTIGLSQVNPTLVLEMAAAGESRDWRDKYMLTDKDVEQFKDPAWIYENLIMCNHWTTLVAEPNGGKTSLMMYLAPRMVAAGYSVTYIDADTGAADAKDKYYQCKDGGVSYLTPDLVEGGMGAGNVTDDLRMLVTSGADLSHEVIVVDTLKKFTDVVSKATAKKFYGLLRKLTGRGATLIVLSHTNKYRDSDGKPVFEGTGDLRSDSDELIYLIPKHSPDGSMVMTTDVTPGYAKLRGIFSPISFSISEDREVTPLPQVVDTVTANQEAKRYAKDKDAILAIEEAIGRGITVQKFLKAYVQEMHRVGWRTADKVLARYSTTSKDSCEPGKRWFREQRKNENNAVHYVMLNSPWVDPVDVMNANIRLSSSAVVMSFM